MTDFATLKKEVDAQMALWADSRAQNSLGDALRYALDGGKRLRPVMLLAGALSANGDILTAMPFAVAIELIHNYSLIHDDMPCMDNDDYRRGLPTVHKRFGQWTALLAGDALLNGAYEILLSHADTQNKVAAGRIIAQSAGIDGMIHGQFLDLTQANPDADMLLEISTYKTGALFSGALTAGAALFGANAEVLSSLSAFGRNFGLAFQIADDLDDYNLGIENTAEKNRNIYFTAGKVLADNQKKKFLENAISSAKNLKNPQILLEIASFLE